MLREGKPPEHALEAMIFHPVWVRKKQIFDDSLRTLRFCTINYYIAVLYIVKSASAKDSRKSSISFLNSLLMGVSGIFLSIRCFPIIRNYSRWQHIILSKVGGEGAVRGFAEMILDAWGIDETSFPAA